MARPDAVRAALERRPSLNREQSQMVEDLTRSGRGVEVVVGKAGTGKTFALDAARDAWEASGIKVIGCALSARAAKELEAGSGIESSTIAALMKDLDDFRSPGLDRDTVIVVDEAGMVGTRQLEALLTHAQQAGAKVVLVGDDKQLPEIAAGGAFRALKKQTSGHRAVGGEAPEATRGSEMPSSSFERVAPQKRSRSIAIVGGWWWDEMRLRPGPSWWWIGGRHHRRARRS